MEVLGVIDKLLPISIGYEYRLRKRLQRDAERAEAERKRQKQRKQNESYLLSLPDELFWDNLEEFEKDVAKQLLVEKGWSQAKKYVELVGVRNYGKRPRGHYYV